MKNKFLALILTAAVICGAILPSLTLTARAAEVVDSGDCGTNVTWALDSTGTLTISGSGEMHDYDFYENPWYSHRNQIKKIFIENGVANIGASVFSNCNVLTNITIPQSVTSIGNSAFNGCVALTDIAIPSSVTSVGDYSFYGCTGLTTITIPNSMTSIGYCAFWGCTGLTSITIPESVTRIRDAAFSGCTNLTDIKIDPGNSSYCAQNGVLFDKDFATLLCYPAGKTDSTYAIPNGVTGIGGSAFEACTGLTGVAIPDGVTYIGDTAFIGCAGLTNVMIPDSVTYIGWGAFSGCTSLTSVTMPNRITSIEQNTFSSCTSLVDITIPSSVTSIGDDAFSSCTGLTSILIPDSVTSIGDFAFGYCDGLTNITIPASVTSIGDAVFRRCTSLTDITVAPGNPSYCAPNGVLFDKNCTKLLCYPAGKTDSTYAIPSGVMHICDSAFDGCSCLTNITIPDGVTSIGHSAFSGCNGLTNITIPASVTSIGDFAFSYCYGLTNITIPASVTSIGNFAFIGCDGLTNITIPESVTRIGDAAFSGCTGLTGITVDPENPNFCAQNGVLFDKDFATLLCYPAGKTDSTYAIPSGVMHICDSAFDGCSCLTNITIPDGVTSIGHSAFSGCNGLTNITIPASVTSIGDFAFSYCYGLTNITIPASVTSIGVAAFGYCTSLTDITVDPGNPSYCAPDGVLFDKNCTKLLCYPAEKTGSTYAIPNGVTSICQSAFYGCANLTDITIPDGVTDIGDDAFSSCTGLTSILIPDSVTSIGDAAFSGCTGLTNVVIPNSVTCIEWDTFNFCTSLTSITIPESVTRIDVAAFGYCTGLTSITVDPGNPSYCAPNGVLFDKNCTKLLCYPAGKTDSTYAIPSGVMHICDSAFDGCSCLTNITIPDGVTSIGHSAFSGCNGLTNITIPASVTSIGVAAFGYCTSLTDITVDPENPNFCAQDGVLFDKNCTKLLCYPAEKTGSTYAIPNGVTSICESAFYGCANLTDITIPDGVTDIGINAFRFCCGLTSITIPESVTRIGVSAFSECTGLTNVVIPNSVTCIKWGTFNSCTSLTSIIIPDSVTNIGSFAFGNCTALQSMCFQGDAPQCKADAFSWMDEDSAASINNPNLTIYYIDGKEGWTTPMWNGYPTATWDGVNLPKPHEHDYKTVVTAPTCTEQGYTTHTCECGASYVDAYTDALGHDWGDPVYEWADDHSAITATRVCKRDPDHTEAENGVVTSAVTKEATYDAEGEITYTAAFANPAFEPQTAVVSLPRLERPTPTPAENPFADIHESAYYHDPVLWAVANNVTNGTSDSTFSPDEGCTRAQVVTFLWRAAGKPDPASSKSPFSDVKEGAYYYNAVLWAVEKGITNGTSDKTFSPDETCTRAQIVTFLWRYEEQPASAGTSNPFADVKPNAYFGSAVLWAVEKGITNGTSATTFDPEDTCTRAQVVTFLYRDIVKS